MSSEPGHDGCEKTFSSPRTLANHGRTHDLDVTVTAKYRASVGFETGDIDPDGAFLICSVSIIDFN